MSNGQIAVGPNFDRSRMIFRVELEDGAMMSVALEAAKVDELIEKIGFARAGLRHRGHPDPGSLTLLEFAELHANWKASADVAVDSTTANSCALCLHHSVYGWLTFVLPDADARSLGQWILDTTTPG